MFSLFRSTPRQPHVFRVNLQCLPISCYDEKKEALEYGDKILLPGSACNTLVQMEVSYPMIFQLKNQRTGKTIHCGVLEFVADEGLAYIPLWMMEHLGLSDAEAVEVLNVTIPKGSFVQIRPHKTTFIELSNPRVVLEHALRNFATLTQGSTIRIRHAGHVFNIDIVETRPANSIVVIETDLQVDFVEPKDYKEIEEKKKKEAELKRAQEVFNFGATQIASPIPTTSATSAPSVASSATSTPLITPITNQPASSTPQLSASTTTSSLLANRGQRFQNTQKSDPSYFASLGAGRSLTSSSATSATSTTSTASIASAVPTPASSSATTTPGSTYTTKVAGNFTYYYDAKGKLVKRIPLAKTTSSSVFTNSAGRSMK